MSEIQSDRQEMDQLSSMFTELSVKDDDELLKELDELSQDNL